MRTGMGSSSNSCIVGRRPRPAGAATAQPARPGGNAYQTIGELEAAGYDVVIDRVGSAPIGQCFVTNVRNPQEVTQTIAVGEGNDREYHHRCHQPVDHRFAELRRLIRPSGGRLAASAGAESGSPAVVSPCPALPGAAADGVLACFWSRT